MNILRSWLPRPAIYAVLTCSLWLLVFTPAHATPPAPPVQLLLPKADELAALQPENGSFTVIARVRARQEALKVTLIVSTTKTGTLGRREDQAARQEELKALRKGETRQVTIKISAQPQDGIYRIEAALQIERNGQTGVVSKGVIIEIVEKGQPRLTTPEELRRTQVLQQKLAFQDALVRKPDQPDIRLLMDRTVPVPPDLAKNVKMYTGPKQKRIRGSGPPSAIKPYILNKTKIDKPKDGHLRQKPGIAPVPLIELKGQVVFEDWYTNLSCNPYDPNDPYYPCDSPLPNVLTPLANATITVIVDTALGYDLLVAETVTDENGEWDVYTDPFLEGADIYYTVSLGNDSFDVRDNAGNDYVWWSATRSASGIVNYGQETFATNKEAAQVFAVVNRGWNHIVTEGGQDPGHIAVQYPDFCLVGTSTTSCWDPTAEVVRIESSENDGPDVILHEYGHALMHYAFGGTSIGGGEHSFDDKEQDPGLAYSEGWATAFAMAVCPDGHWAWHEAPYEYPADEWPVCSADYDPGVSIELFCHDCDDNPDSDGDGITDDNRIGLLNEGRIAAAINDFVDASNDDNGGDEDLGATGWADANENERISLATIYRDHMWGFLHFTFLDFLISLESDLSSTSQSLADDIEIYNYIAFCVASKVAMAKSPDYATVLDGLRAFRDRMLKPLQAGRHGIQSYYSHSPEMAILLIGSPESRQAAQVIIEHFSGLGRSLRSPEGQKQLSVSREPVLPKRVSEAVAQVAGLIEKKGSTGLKKDMAEALAFLKTFDGMTVAQADHYVSTLEKVREGRGIQIVQPMKFAPASRNVDWALIWKNLPGKETKKSTDETSH